MERIAVVGLGYVGLPVALAFARRLPHVVGFDVDPGRVAELRQGRDRTGEADPEELGRTPARFTDDPDALRGSSFFVVTVPTPIDAQRRPDLGALRAASRTVGRALAPGAVVVFESTVYPGVTEEVCGPVLEEASGLVRGKDFKLGYSPERINPGDRERRLERIVKVVSGEDDETLERVAAAYESIVEAGVHRAPSIRVAEAAKVIENTQRDLNIALMNELAILFDRLDIPTRDVLAAAATKWNFLPFTPGLVGGHCIGVDPYYLTAKAEAVGYHPQVILAGRRVNDGMGAHVARRVVKHLIRQGHGVRGARVAVLGVTFKENVPDVRNSKVPDIVRELADFDVTTDLFDPLADPRGVHEEYGIRLATAPEGPYDAVILAVPHRVWLADDGAGLLALLRPDGVLFDVKSALDRSLVPPTLHYAAL